jgi:hypothetical protein
VLSHAFLCRARRLAFASRLSARTDFRNVLNNLQLTFGNLTGFVELQLHHAKIYELNELRHAHDHLDYWRAALSGGYNRDLDSFLVRTFKFLEEINGNPVLLSMLVMCLKSQKPGRIWLPTSVLELYQMAIEGALQERKQDAAQALSVLSSVATANMLAGGRRVFSSTNAMKAAGGPKAWMSLADEQGEFPLIKVLEEGEQPLFAGVVRPLDVARRHGRTLESRCVCPRTGSVRGLARTLPVSPPQLPRGPLRPRMLREAQPDLGV